ncbi:MAG: hypothetical protein AAF492_27585, partial [Verrucomicrobiota bacterium]
EANQDRVIACVRLLWDFYRTLSDAPQRAGAIVAWLKTDTEGSDLARAAFSVTFLLDAPDPAGLCRRMIKYFRDRIRYDDPTGAHLRPLLNEARALFAALGAPQAYTSLYHAAMDALAAGTGETHLDESHRSIVTDLHPAPDAMAPILNGIWESGELGLRPTSGPEGHDDPMWRQRLFELCRDKDNTARLERIRRWLIGRAEAILTTRPDRLPAFLEHHRGRFTTACPEPLELRGWIKALEALDEVNLPHLQTLAHLAPNENARAVLQRWCQLFEQLGEALNPLDRSEWLRLGLDLLSTTLDGDPALMTRTVLKLKNVNQLMIMRHPGLVQVSEQIMACENDLLNHLLPRAALGFLNRIDDQIIARLRASGLGIHLDRRDFERLCPATPIPVTAPVSAGG